MGIIIAVLVTFTMLAVAEIHWRRKKYHEEFARKIVHMSVGTFVAFWPLFLEWNEIRMLSLAFVAVVAVSLRLKVFRSIHAVERPTWGEVMFALSVGLITLITNDPLIYTVAILHMSLADGMAAIVGIKYGHANSYCIFAHKKSLIGSLTFLAVSLAILAVYIVLSGSNINTGYVFVLALAATALENAGWRGLDNLFVPLLIAVALEKL